MLAEARALGIRYRENAGRVKRGLDRGREAIS